MPGSEAEFESPARQSIERRCLPGELDRVAHVIIEDERTESDAFSLERDRRQRNKWRATWPDVITDNHKIETQILCALSDLNCAGLVASADLIPESNHVHTLGNATEPENPLRLSDPCS